MVDKEYAGMYPVDSGGKSGLVLEVPVQLWWKLIDYSSYREYKTPIKIAEFILRIKLPV